MEYLIGWGLLVGIVLMIWLIICLAGGEREEPRATCGVDGCAGSRRATSRP